MNLIAILAALGLEQWRAFRWRASVERAFVQYARAVERRLNGGTAQQGMVATVIALAPPVVLAAAVFFALTALHPLLGLAWNVAALYLLMGFRRFSHAFTDVRDALADGNLAAARRALAAWRGVRSERAHERGHREARDRTRSRRFVSAGIRDALLVHGAARSRGRGALPRRGAACG